MTPFTDCRCPVTECDANRGERGCYCWYLRADEPCDHPVWRRIWARLMEQAAYLAHRDGDGRQGQEWRGW